MSGCRKPRRHCPACQKLVSVRKDGTLNPHKGPVNTCAGSSRTIADVTREVEARLEGPGWPSDPKPTYYPCDKCAWDAVVPCPEHRGKP